MGVLTKEELELEYKSCRRDGRIDSAVEFVINSMKSYGVDVEEAMENLKIDLSIRDKVRAEVIKRHRSASPEA